MEKTGNKIIIFKSDRVGDLINFSPCLKIIKENKRGSHITLVCSKYNYQIAKNYKDFVDKFIIIDKNSFFVAAIINFRLFFFRKYQYLFQLDGKNRSYWLSLFVRSKIKSTICFAKQRNIFGIKYISYRPSRIFHRLFKNREFSNESYDQHSHYQSIYFKLLENLNFKNLSKKNLFYLDTSFEKTFSAFYDNILRKEYILFHFDEKWDNFEETDKINILKIINKISLKNKVVVTLGIRKFKFANRLRESFTSYSFMGNKLFLDNKRNNTQILLLNNIPLNLLAYLVKNSLKNVSSHAGSIVHISAAFDVEILDIVKKNKNSEYDRWIPSISNYKRINFEDINHEFIENI